MSGCPANIRADARTGARLPAPAAGVRGRHLPCEALNGRARRRGSGAGSRKARWRNGQIARVYQPASQPRRPPTRTPYQVRPERSFATRTTPTLACPASVKSTRDVVEGPDRTRSAAVVTRRAVTDAAFATATVAVALRGTAAAAVVARPVWRKAVNRAVVARIEWMRTPFRSVEIAMPFPR